MTGEWIEQRRLRALARYKANPVFTAEQRAALELADSMWVARSLKPATRVYYARFAYLLATRLKKPFEQVTKEELRAVIVELATTCAPKYVDGFKRFLKTFYLDLLSPDSQTHPPLVSWIRLANPLTSAKLPSDLVSVEEMKRIADAASHPMERAMIMLLYDSAARASELCSLFIRDIEWDEYGARAMLSGKTGMRKVRLIASVPDLRVWFNHHPHKDDPMATLFLGGAFVLTSGPPVEYTVRRILQKAVRRAGIRKRVYPHLLRHSRLTQLAKVLSESELKVFAGWTADSPMAKVYIHLSGDDVDRKMLEKAGLLQREDVPKVDSMQPRVCPRCASKNSPASSVCTSCSVPLDETKLQQVAYEQELLRTKLPALLRLIEDPEIAKLLARKTNERAAV